MIISFDIPDPKVQRVIDAIKYFYPIPLDADGSPLFTDGQWAKEAIRRHLISLDRRYRVVTERNIISINLDDNLVS